MSSNDISVNTTTLLQGGLNVGMMASFCYHVEGVRFGPGQKAGIFFAVAVGLMQAFYPRPNVVDPDPVATASDVDTALTNMAQEVIDKAWWGAVQMEQSIVLANLKSFQNVWGGVFGSKGICVNPNGTLVVGSSNKERDDFVKGKYNYLNPFDSNSLLEVLRAARNRLETSSLSDPLLTAAQLAERPRLTMGLYGIIGSLTASYLSACVIWAWTRELQMGWEYQSYQTELQAWNKNGQPILSQSLEDKYDEVNAASGYQPLDWNAFVDTPGCCVHLLQNEVKQMLDYCGTLPMTDDTTIADLFNKNVEGWKALSASVQFEVYTVKSGGEYLGDIARAKYGNDSYEQDLFSANSDTLDSATVYPPYIPPPPGPKHGFFNDDQAPPEGFVPAGTKLKIYVLAALPYNLSPFKLGK